MYRDTGISLLLRYPHLGVSLSRDFRFLFQSLSGFRESDQFPTASYCAVIDHRGELYFAIGDMDVHQSVDVEWVSTLSAMHGVMMRSCDVT